MLIFVGNYNANDYNHFLVWGPNFSLAPLAKLYPHLHNRGAAPVQNENIEPRTLPCGTPQSI